MFKEKKLISFVFILLSCSTLLASHGVDLFKLVYYKSTTPEYFRLLSKGPEALNVVDEYGEPLLHRAIGEGRIDLVRVFVDLNANLNIVDKHKNSALMDAVVEHRYLITSLLIDHGANLEQVDSNGLTALNRAEYSNIPEMISLLLQKGANPRGGRTIAPLVSAAINGRLAVVKALLGASTEQDIEEAISNARSRNYLEVAEVLEAQLNSSL